MSRMLLAVAAVIGLASALPASAQFQKPEDAIKYRQSAMFVMGNHMGRLGAMVQGRVPFDAAQAAANADVLLVMSKLPFAGFTEGTTAANSKAKPEIWTERAKFDAGAQRMQEAIVKLNEAAKSANLDQIKAAFGPVGQACKSCHDAYWKQ
ncbi:MAG: cytochrome c [Rubrivivax sp.]|nr:cytochrome c [Rubrivivax sp.]